MSRAKSARVALATAFFAVSGATALAYEVIWFKRFSHAFGSSAAAWAAVVAAYLAGLGLGARVFGARAANSRSPLFAYGACEIAIAIFAVLVPFEISALIANAGSLAQLFGDAALARASSRFLLAFAVLAPPTIAMGATLPLLVRHFSANGIAAGAATAWLYAANALGAAAGAALAGFVLLPTFGFAGSNWIAVFASAAVGVAAMAISRPLLESHSEIAPAAAELDAATPPLAALRVAAAATGAGALALQMLWARELAVLLGASTYAYTAVLAIFVAGLGVGAALHRAFVAGRADLRGALAFFVALLVASTLVGFAAQPWIAQALAFVKSSRADGGVNAVVCASASLMLEGLATVAMGAIFPALVELAARSTRDGARAASSIYAWNTLGSIPAALLTYVIVLPELGHDVSIKLALASYVVALVVLVPPTQARAHPLALGVTLASCLALAFLPRPLDPLDTHLGYALYGSEVGAGRSEFMRVLEFASGETSDILVVGEHEDALPGDPAYAQKKRDLFVNGKVDATNTGDMSTQIATALLPMLAAPQARDVLVIGFGSGTSVGTALSFPGTKVTCCEIEPAVAHAAPQFADVNHRPWESPNYREVHEDGRGYLQSSTETFDVIVSEPSNPWMVGVSNLFTREAYLAVRSRLRPNGVFGQWLQNYTLSLREYAMVVRTLKSVFPYVALMRVSTSDTVLLASASPLFAEPAKIDEAQKRLDSARELFEQLDRYFATRDVRSLILVHYALGAKGVDQLLAIDGGTVLNTDLDLRLEFDAPRWLFGPAEVVGAPRPLASVYAAYDVGLLRDLCTHLGCGAKQVDALRAWVGAMKSAGRTNVVQQIVELGLTYAPDDAQLLADEFIYAPSTDPEEAKARVEHLIATAPEFALRAAATLAQGGASSRALPLLEALRAKSPQSVRVLTALATVYGSLAREADAKKCLDEALAIDPYDDLAVQLKRVLDSKH